MCGRFACGLSADDLSCACSQKDPGTGLYVKTTIKFSETYNPSYNIAPTTLAPMLIDLDGKRTAVLGQFGVIPPWLKPELRKPSMETHLCRLESITTSKLYKTLLAGGLRCVIPCIGFYEWQSTQGPTRQPYLFHNKENEFKDIESLKAEWSEENGWKGLKLLYLAGVYTKRNDKLKPEYSFAIITQEEHTDWKWIHHRIPGILQSEEHVNIWLQSKQYNYEEALEVLKSPIQNIDAYPVDKGIINNTRNNVCACIRKYKFPKQQTIKGVFTKEDSAQIFEMENSSRSLEVTKKNTGKSPEKKTNSNILTNWLQKSIKKSVVEQVNSTASKEDKKRLSASDSSSEDGSIKKKRKFEKND